MSLLLNWFKSIIAIQEYILTQSNIIDYHSLITKHILLKAIDFSKHSTTTRNDGILFFSFLLFTDRISMEEK